MQMLKLKLKEKTMMITMKVSGGTGRGTCTARGRMVTPRGLLV
jgi:hypothetical protein